MSKYTWELDFNSFANNAKTERMYIRTQDGKHSTITHTTGCMYRLYVDENLNLIKPYSIKKDKGKTVLQTFTSYISREDAIRQAYNWILTYASKNELYNSRYYKLTFNVWYKKHSGKLIDTVEYPFLFPYNGDNRCFFDSIRDEIGSNGTDIESIEFVSQEIHN